MQNLENYTAGHTEKGNGYSYFVPAPINEQWVWQDAGLNILLEKASKALGELNSYARLVPNIDMFIHLHVTKEAVVSSKIEGTRTNINEAILPEDEINPERRDDWTEVRNYTTGLNEAIEALAKLPLSTRLLKKTHKTLLDGVRGKHKMPGEFRTSQNWIGGVSLANAHFVPPAAHYVDQLMGDLENFLHNEDIQVPILIRAGMAHYQFETIHPFLNGNGRIGRLLITLYLVDSQILGKPLLYLSAFFEKNKGLYYDGLTAVREKNAMLPWLKYFLTGVEETSNQAVKTLSQILKLKEDTEGIIKKSLKRKTVPGLLLLDHLFNDPYVNVNKVTDICHISVKAANDLVQDFVGLDILQEISHKKRYRIFIFPAYLQMFEG